MVSVDEFALIRLLTSGIQSDAMQREAGVVTGIGDDAAVVQVNEGMQLIVTCDTMTEDVHFKSVTMRDSDIGFKAMASAVSDIAAMGGTPRFALVALCLPRTITTERVRRMYEGLYECANRYSIAVIGGDTTSSAGGMTITVTVIGEAPSGQALLRSRAEVGDVVFTTGYAGESAAGLDLLLRQGLPLEECVEEVDYPGLVRAHCRPLPQIEAGIALRQSGLCHALNDVSDGIASEVWEIAEASNVGIDLIEDRIPISEELNAYALQQGRDPLDFVLFGGEDYQLVGTVPAAQAPELQLQLRQRGIPTAIIGYVTADSGQVRLVRGSGDVMSLEKKGYNHFNGGEDGN